MLPAGQGPSKNIFLKWNGNGPNPTSFTVQKKKVIRPMPSNWPVMVTRSVNAQLRLRNLPELYAHIDTEAHSPSSLLLVGRHQFMTSEEDRRIRYGTRSALLVGINYYDRWLQVSLGSKRKLEVESYERGGVLYVRTNLSITRSLHDLCPPLLADLPDIVPAHFKVYVYRKHRLGVRVDCHCDNAAMCRCRALAESLIPVMWISQ